MCPASASTTTPSGIRHPVTRTFLSEPSAFTARMRPALASRKNKRPAAFLLPEPAGFSLGVWISGILFLSIVRRALAHFGEIRRALLKKRRERLLGFGGAHAGREFLVLELYHPLKFLARRASHQSLASLQRARRFRCQLLRRLSRYREQLLVGHD